MVASLVQLVFLLDNLLLMCSHISNSYICPICLAAQGKEEEATWIVQNDIVYRDEDIFAFISSKSIKGNPGHVLISPVDHFENIYTLPTEIGAKIFSLAQRIALGLKETRSCTGVTTLQCNEPDGGQHAFHYHFHVIPRFAEDNFAEELWRAERCSPEERKEYATSLKTFLDSFQK